MRQAAEAQGWIPNECLPFWERSSTFDKQFTNESSFLGPFVLKYLNSCFHRAAALPKGNAERWEFPACQNDKYAFAEEGYQGYGGT